MSTHLAVDVGNSKTVALVVTDQGAVLGRGRGGRGDIYGADSIEEARTAVFSAVDGALAEAAVAPESLRSSAFRVAGVDWPEDETFWIDELTAHLPGLRDFTIKNDGFASLRLGRDDGVGISITVGTGPAVAGRAHDGREECLGWWCFDALGGAGLAEKALEAVYRNWMGHAPDTALTGVLLNVFEQKDPYELRHSFTRRFGAVSPRVQWHAARHVLACAADGDAVANRIVSEQARHLVDYADWVARRIGSHLGDPGLPVVLNGSIVTSEIPAMRAALLAELEDRARGIDVVVAGGAPLAGAVLDALAEGGVAIDDELRARVVGLDHPRTFLHT